MRTGFLRFLHILILCFAVGAAGCDSDGEDGDNDDGGGDNNDATVEVSGAIDEEYSGTATFASAFGISWVISITLDDDKGSVIVTILGNAGEDTYPINENAQESVASVVLTLTDLEPLQEGQNGTVALTSGSVTISNLDDNRVEGSFSGEGQSLFGDLEVSASGDFEATCFGALCDITD